MLIQPNTKTLILEIEADDPRLVRLDLTKLEYNFRLVFEREGVELAKIDIIKKQFQPILLPFRANGFFEVWLENAEDEAKEVEVIFEEVEDEVSE